jgi:2-polyprenyl-6-hydroxyphenyl methylase/3-demethylubiquinone-9 3-methyltransferase
MEANDLGIYERRADEWWDPSSRTFRSLHAVNAFRAEILREWLGDRLAGARVVDLGCGGGLLADALARQGARVVGVDRSVASLRAAAGHARHGERFAAGDLRHPPLRDACADLVLLADVLEHLDEPAAAVAAAARLLAPGGFLYVNTLNRTRRARVLAVSVAEGLGFIPAGTHDARLFVTPGELREAGERAGLTWRRAVGERPRLGATLLGRAVKLARTESLAIAYSALLERIRG